MQMGATRWAGVAAILFAVLFVVGMTIPGDTPAADESDETIVEYYSDSGNQTALIVAAYVETVAAISLAAFAALSLGSGQAEPLMRVARGSAYLVAAAVAIGIFAIAAVGAGAKFDDAPVDAGAARFLPDVGYGAIFVLGGLAGSAMVGSASLHWLRTRTMPMWLVWFGFLCAVALLFGVVFIPMVALPLWAIAVGVVLLLRKGGAEMKPVMT